MRRKREKAGIGLSLFLGFIFAGSGMGKLFVEHKFPGVIGPTALTDTLAEYGLSLYGFLIAYSQVLIGFMLFTLLFRTLGAVMLLPMIMNILVVVISLEWKGTPYVLAVLLVMNIALLLIDLHRVAPMIGLGSPAMKQIRHPLGRHLVRGSIPIPWECRDLLLQPLARLYFQRGGDHAGSLGVLGKGSANTFFRKPSIQLVLLSWIGYWSSFLHLLSLRR